MIERYHTPVLLHLVVDFLQINPSGVYVDCTLGMGGHTEAIAEHVHGTGKVIGIDQDEESLALAKKRLARFGSTVEYIHGNFAELDQLLTEHGIETVDGILMDIGISSYQLSQPERGFAFSQEGPLDMRMNRRMKLTAADVVNTYSEKDLARIIWEFGEERFSRNIAAAVVKYRKQNIIESTTQLAAVVSGAIPRKYHSRKLHPATRTFQALRIYVNEELDSLRRVLTNVIGFLKPGARLLVISFHSLEDRIVKQMFNEFARKCICPPDFPVCRCDKIQLVKVITRKPVMASEQELEQNPRARSARLRVCEKL